MKGQLRIRDGVMFAFVAISLVLMSRPAAAGNWNVKNVSDLIAAINAANQAGGANTITLARGKTFTLTAVNNTIDGPTGLPVVAPDNNLTIQGNGATIARSTAPGTPPFRLFDVASGAALTLQNLTLASGLVIGDTGMDASGGAILNAAGASLTVTCSVIVSNQVVGGDGAGGLGGLGVGGAVCNNGTANFDSVTFRGNQATGGATTDPEEIGLGGLAGAGAISSQNLGTLMVRNCLFTGNKAMGGRLHEPSQTWMYDGVAASGAIDNWGTALISGTTFTDNQAIGGTADEGVDGGYGLGGAVGSGGPFAINSVCTLQNCRFSRNQAIGGPAGQNNFGGAVLGGALSTGYAQVTSDMTITGSLFTDNRAIGGQGGYGGVAGGGVINQESPLTVGNKSTLTIAKSVFTDNQAIGGDGADGYGGAIVNQDWNVDDGSGATLVISNCTFARNAAIGSPGGDGINVVSIGQSGAVDTFGNATIKNSIFLNNRAVGTAMLPSASATPAYFTTSFGGGLSSWGGTLDIRETCFVGNQVLGGDASLGGPAGMAMGGGIAVLSGMPATIVNCSLFNNTVVGGAGSNGIPGGAGVGGGLNVGLVPPPWNTSASGPSSVVTVTGTIIGLNQATGGANGGEAKGGGYAVGTGVLFGFPDTSSVTLNGGSVAKGNKPDDAFQF